MRLRVVSCYLLVVSCATALARSQTPAPSGIIIGQVVDATTNRPVPEADVRLRTGNGQTPPAGRVIADSEGRYFFAGLAAGTYQLQAAKAGYAEGFYGMRRPPRITALPGVDGLGLELREGQRVLDATILLWKHASISGVVTDETGEPMVGIIVRPFMRTIVNGRPRFVGSGSIDRGHRRSGHLSRDRLPPGDYRHRRRRHTFNQAGCPASWSSRERDVTHRLLRREPGSSPYRDRSGPSGSATTCCSTHHGLADPDGVRVRPIGWLSTRRRISPACRAMPEAGVVSVAAGEERGGVSIQMRPDAVCAGLRPARGLAGLSRAALAAVDAGRDRRPPAARIPYQRCHGVDRHVRTVHVSRGAARLIRAEGRRRSRSPAPGRRRCGRCCGRPSRSPSAPLTSTVSCCRCDRQFRSTDGSSWLAAWNGQAGSASPLAMSVSFDPVVGDGLGFSVRSDSKGAFSTGLPGGSYYVSAQPPPGWFVSSIAVGGRVLNDSPIDVTGDALDLVVTLTNAPSRVTVTVRDAPAAADGSVRVIVFPADRSAWSDHGPTSQRFQTSRGGCGRLYLRRPAGGEYFIAAVREEHAIEWLDPKFLDVLSRFATRVTVFEGQSQSVDVRLSVVR